MALVAVPLFTTISDKACTFVFGIGLTANRVAFSEMQHVAVKRNHVPAQQQVFCTIINVKEYVTDSVSITAIVCEFHVMLQKSTGRREEKSH